MNDKADSAMDKFWNSEKGIKYFIVVIIGMVVVSLLLTFALILKEPGTQEPPVTYSQDVYYPEKEEYCPGEKAEVKITVRLDYAPSIVQIINTIWSSDQHRTVVFDYQPEWVITSDVETIHRTIVVDIPDQPPGKYEYRQAASLDYSEPSFFAIPFTISETCP